MKKYFLMAIEKGSIRAMHKLGYHYHFCKKIDKINAIYLNVYEHILIIT